MLRRVPRVARDSTSGGVPGSFPAVESLGIPSCTDPWKPATMTEFAFIELTSNKAVEDAAIAFVLDYERQQGRSARDTRGQRQPADVSSDGRIIAVKAYGRSARSTDPWRTHLHTVAVTASTGCMGGTYSLVSMGTETVIQLIQFWGPLGPSVERRATRMW